MIYLTDTLRNVLDLHDLTALDCTYEQAMSLLSANFISRIWQENNICDIERWTGLKVAHSKLYIVPEVGDKVLQIVKDMHCDMRGGGNGCLFRLFEYQEKT